MIDEKIISSCLDTPCRQRLESANVVAAAMLRSLHSACRNNASQAANGSRNLGQKRYSTNRWGRLGGC